MSVNPRQHAGFTRVELPAVSRRKRGAFTLVELLVVVAILALLISMLMPTLARAKELAKDAYCRTNLRNIGTAFGLYSEDNDGWLPVTCYSPSATFSGWKPYWETWNNFLAQYPENSNGWGPKPNYADPGLFACPSYEWDVSTRGTYGINHRMSHYEDKGASWIRRDPAYDPNEPDPHRSGWNYNFKATFRPGEMYLVGDSDGPIPGVTGHRYGIDYVNSGSKTMHFRHLGRVNVVYHDQHADGLAEDEVLWSGSSGWKKMPWWNRQNPRW